MVEQFFAESPWAASKFPGETLLRFAHQGVHASWVCFAQVHESVRRVVVYSVPYGESPVERRAEVAEFLTRANYGLHVGNFEMDVDDGEIRFKTSVDLEGSELSQEMLRRLVQINLSLVDRYLVGIQLVLAGSTPLEAVEIAEGRGDAGDGLGK